VETTGIFTFFAREPVVSALCRGGPKRCCELFAGAYKKLLTGQEARTADILKSGYTIHSTQCTQPMVRLSVGWCVMTGDLPMRVLSVKTVENVTLCACFPGNRKSF
jgi:hypothetical protein